MIKIASILTKRYGVTIENAPNISMRWAVELLLESDGIDIARKNLKAMNRKLEKLGRMPVYFDYGHPLF